VHANSVFLQHTSFKFLQHTSFIFLPELLIASKAECVELISINGFLFFYFILVLAMSI
jgi:hypothetical protein